MKTIGQIRRDAANRVAGLGGPNRIELLADGTIKYGGSTYPVAGAKAEFAEYRSGFLGRRHTWSVTVELADGETLIYTRTKGGSTVTPLLRQAITFTNEVNRAARKV